MQSEYLTENRYASVYVNSPDLRKFCPSLGQRLIIQWRAPKKYENLELKLRLRLKNYQQIEKTIPLATAVGRCIYNLMDEEYFCSGGFLCYRVELYADGCLLSEVVHHLWEELIVLDVDEETSAPNEIRYQDSIRTDGTGFYDIGE